MKKLIASIDHFFFQKISATGFGLMRICWAGTLLMFYLPRLTHTTFLYSNEGIIPPELYGSVFRSAYRFTILDYITHPTAVSIVFLIFLIAAICTLLGIYTRISTIVCTLLLFSLHERNLLVLGGGDTTLRTIGFILMIAPQIKALSIERAKEQWKHWRNTREFLDPLTMPIWPSRLLLWQIMIIYVTSGWEKALGTMWHDGTAVASALHHEHFNRVPMWVMDTLTELSPFITGSTLYFEFVWLLLLIPAPLLHKGTRGLVHSIVIKRIILLWGVLFHGGIFLLMKVGSFPQAMLTGYCGLLVEEDFTAARTALNRGRTDKIAVLYDSKCYFCRRSVFVLKQLDHLRRMQLVDFHDKEQKDAIAPDLAFEELDKSMHIRMPDGRTEKGFDAFRVLAWHIPLFWIIAPILYIPGIPPLGRKIYQWIADNRKKCTDERCEI